MREKLYGIRREITLKDGSTIYVREVREEDKDSLIKLYTSLSSESLTFRFFGKPSEESIRGYVERAIKVDGKNSFGVVAIHGGKIVGHAEYYTTSKDTAEVAFTISDEFQGKGIGTALLGVLAEMAERNGIKMFEAWVDPDNYKMIKVFRDSGFPVKLKLNWDVIHITMPTAITEDVLEHFEKRDKIAAINALKRFLYPKTVAIIGASRNRKKVGGKVLYNMFVYNFNGTMYPINKATEFSQGIKTYSSILDVPSDVDLAVICVPAEYVLEIVEDCKKKNVKALLILTAGFAEIGEEGKKRQDELIKLCKKLDIRVIGPNCMGLINTDPKIRLNATFAPNPPIDGRIGFASQSGAVGLAVMDYANSYGLGLSAFVSLGNRVDISSNDLIEYWEDDERTDLIMLYLESFGNPRKFSRIAKRVSKKKPILALASGITPAGAKAVSSHTGAIISASGVAIDALFKQTGVIRASSLHELFLISSFLLHQPLPNGKDVCIITNGGGLGAITSDWCEEVGLNVPDLTSKTKNELKKILPAIASVRNPIDMTAGAEAKDYYDVIKFVAKDEVVDSLIVIFVQAVSIQETEEVVKNVLNAAKYANKLGKPVIFIYVGADSKEGIISDGEVTIPVYRYPHNAAKVLSKSVEYSIWKKKPKEPIPTFDDIDKDKAAAIIANSLGKEWMMMNDAFELLKCYGISMPEYVYASIDELDKLNIPFDKVAVKAVGDIVHKTDVGAVKTNLNAKEAVEVAKEMAERLKNHNIRGFIFQKMVDGVEMFIGVAEDPSFGPLITCGAGGIFVELFKDVSVRVTPITRSEAYEMVTSLKSFPMLTGYRGQKKTNVDAFVEAILRINALIEDFPEIVELDCNPVIVHESADAVDVRIRLRT